MQAHEWSLVSVENGAYVDLPLAADLAALVAARPPLGADVLNSRNYMQQRKSSAATPDEWFSPNQLYDSRCSFADMGSPSQPLLHYDPDLLPRTISGSQMSSPIVSRSYDMTHRTHGEGPPASLRPPAVQHPTGTHSPQPSRPRARSSIPHPARASAPAPLSTSLRPSARSSAASGRSRTSAAKNSLASPICEPAAASPCRASIAHSPAHPRAGSRLRSRTTLGGPSTITATSTASPATTGGKPRTSTSPPPPRHTRVNLLEFLKLQQQEQQQQPSSLNTSQEQYPPQPQGGTGRHTCKGSTATTLAASGGSPAAGMMLTTTSSRGGQGRTRTPSPSSRARSPSGACNGGPTIPPSCSVSCGSGSSAPPINLGDLPAGALRRVDVQLRRADSGVVSAVTATAGLPSGPLSAPECISRSPPHVTSWLVSQEGDGGGEETGREGEERDGGNAGAWDQGELGHVQGRYMGAAEPGSRSTSPAGQQASWGRGHSVEYPPAVCEPAARDVQSMTWAAPLAGPLRAAMAAIAPPPVTDDLHAMLVGVVRPPVAHALPACQFGQPAAAPLSAVRRSTMTDLVGACGLPSAPPVVLQAGPRAPVGHGAGPHVASLTSQFEAVIVRGGNAQRRPEPPPSANSTATLPVGAAAVTAPPTAAAAPSVVCERSVVDVVSRRRTVAICEAVPQPQAVNTPTVQYGAPRPGAHPPVVASPGGKSHGISGEAAGTGREAAAAPSSPPAAAVDLRHLPSWAPLYGSKAASPVKDDTQHLSASRSRSLEGHTDRGGHPGPPGHLPASSAPTLLVPRSTPRDWSVEDGGWVPNGDGGGGDPSCSSKRTLCTGRRVVGHAGGEEVQGPSAAESSSHSCEVPAARPQRSYPLERPLESAAEGAPLHSCEVEEGRKQEEEQPVAMTLLQVVAAAVAVDGPQECHGDPRDGGLSLQRELQGLRQRLEVLEVGAAASTHQAQATSATTAVAPCVHTQSQAPADTPRQPCARAGNGGDKGEVSQPVPQQHQYATAIATRVAAGCVGVESSGAVQGALREALSGPQHPVALLAALATEAAQAAEARAEAQQRKLEDLEAQLAATRAAAEVAEAKAEARLAALAAQVVALQGELRRQQEASREALDQLAKGTEHVAACMLSAFMPVAGGSGGGGGSGGSGGGEGGGSSVAVTTPAAGEGSSQRPSLLHTDEGVAQEPPPLSQQPPSPPPPTMTPRTITTETTTAHQGSAPTTSRSGEHCVSFLDSGGDGDGCVTSATLFPASASVTHRTTRAANARPRSRGRMVSSSVEYPASSAMWRSPGHMGGGEGGGGRGVLPSGGASAAGSAVDVRRQLRALQQEMRRLRALMAAKVVVAAVGTGGGGGGGLGRQGQGCGVGVSQRVPLQQRSCQLRGQRVRGTAGLEGAAAADRSKEQQQVQDHHQPHRQLEVEGGGGGGSTAAASQQEQEHQQHREQQPQQPQVPGAHHAVATGEGQRQGEGQGDVGVSEQRQEQGQAGLWQKVLRLGSDVGELRWGEAVMVETQDTLIELVTDLRRDLEELRVRGSRVPSRTPSPCAARMEGGDGGAPCVTPRDQQEASMQPLQPLQPHPQPHAQDSSCQQQQQPSQGPQQQQQQEMLSRVEAEPSADPQG